MKISVDDADELSELEGLSDAELIRRVRSGFKKFRSGFDGSGSGLGARNLEEADVAQDDPEHTPGSPPPPERNGGRLNAQDRAAVRDAGLATAQALAELEIRQRGGANMDGELLASRTRRADPNTLHAMDGAVPGYGRLK